MGEHPAIRHEYFRIERERRFLLERLPEHVDADDYVRLHDRFVEGAFLRLRRVERPDGREVVTKLAQKIIDPDARADPRRRRMTTIYLEPGQATALQRLPGTMSVKRRYTVRDQGWTWSLDVWEMPTSAAGLILAEVECSSDAELAGIVQPAWAAREVTDDPRYSAFALAQC